MKKKLVLGGALVLLAALMAWGTWAYFTAEAHVTNVITTGTIDIELKETTKDGDGVEVAFPTGGISGVMPGMSVDKLVRVKNVSTSPAWVRVGVSATITGAEGDSLPLTLSATENVLKFDIQPGWIDGGDGYYYYETPMDPPKLKDDGTKTEVVTPPLFTQVTFNPKMPNDYQGCTVDIVVSAQAVQVKNNNSYTIGDKTVVLEKLTDDTLEYINGWPAAD